MEIFKMKMHIFLVPFFPRVSFQGAGRRIRRFRRFLRAGHKGRAFSSARGAGRSKTEFEGSLHDLPNSLVAVGLANALGDMGIAGACGEHDLDGHVVEFGNLQLAASPESGYVLHRLNSRNSLILSSIHACAFSCT